MCKMTELKESNIIKLATGVKEQLENIAILGFNEVYDEWNDMLVDLWADLPWDYESSRKAQAWIVRHPDFYKTAMQLMEMYEVNMLTEFGKSINFIDEELNLK